MGASLNYKPIKIVFYSVRREVLYCVYETPPIEIQRGIAQDPVPRTFLKCDK